MKKGIFLVLLIAVLAVGGAFAQEFNMSAGIGGILGGDFGGGIKATGGGQEMTVNIPNFGTGFYGFFDATYAEVFVSFLDLAGPITATVGDKTQGVYADSNRKPIEGDWKYSMLTFGFLGKFPIKVSDLITIFPALGIDYRMVSSITNGSYKVNENKDFDALWILGGVGMDFNLPIENVPIYIRLEALYGIRLQNAKEKDWLDDLPSGVEGSALLGHGLTAKLAVGYKF